MVASQRIKRVTRWALFGISVLFFGTLLFSSAGVHAQDLVEAGNLGLTEVQDSSGLGQSSFVTIVGRIIRVLLSLLGIITIVMVIYGGFLWMTAGGSEENYEKAKRTLANGAIGLVIVLSAYAITEFVIRSIGGATGTDTSAILGTGGDGGGNVDGGSGDFSSTGTTTTGGLQVKSIIPKGQQDYANLQVAVTFTGIIDETSVTDKVLVEDEAGEVSGNLSVNGDSVVFVPSAPCPAPHTDKKCFTAGKEYTVTVTGGKAGIVSATSKKPLSCSATSCTATFVPGSKIDVTGPTISNIDPIDNEKIPVDQIVPIQALLKDDNAIALGRIEVNGQVVETVTAAANKGVLPQEFLMLTKKFNTKGDAIKKEYQIKITAQDVAGNSVSLSYKVQVAPQTCFNKVKDGDEIDIDCSAPNGQCGLCTNIACTNSLQCANGNFCDPNKKVCGSAPVIKTVQPQDGAPGTFVTLGGAGFGTQIGEVVFLGNPKDDADDVIAPLACTGSWTDTQVVAQVPDGAVDGPISVRNAAGSREETDDQDGLLMRSFEINDVERPGLCSISPATGQPGKTKVTITGNDFLSNSALERKLFIAGYLIEDAVWGAGGANTVTGFTPSLEPGEVSVGVTAKSIASNPLAFTIQEVGGQSIAAATVDTLSPAKGGVGQYVTIKGAGFGTTPNKVYFVVLDKTGKLTADQTVADISFPAQCAKSFWGDQQVVVKVPNLSAGSYAVVVQPFGKSKQSTYKNFEITTDKPGPQVCAMEPNIGPADGKVHLTMYGEGFGAQPGEVLFSANKILVKGNAQASSWNKSSVQVVVPVGVTTGDVYVIQTQSAITSETCTKNPATCSNPMKYTVSDCRVQANSCGTGTMCCGDGTCQKECTGKVKATAVKGVFAWCFSTGDSCDKIEPPRVVEACSESDSKIIPSPAPSSMWTSTDKAGACSNAMISVKFSEPVDPESVDVTSGTESSVYVEECVSEDGTCTEVDDQLVPLTDLVVSAKVDEKNSGFFVVPKNLKPSTMYRVTLTNEILGADTGIALLGPATPLAGNKCKPENGKGVYCFYFKTTEKQGACVVESVGVAPSVFTAEALGPIKDPVSKFKELQMWLPLAFPADKCQVLDPDSYDWAWSPAKKADKDFNFASAMYSEGSKTPYIAKQPTAAQSSIDVIATETKSKKSGKGSLTINLGVPQLTEACEINGPRSPSPASMWGGDVCFDAPVVVEFNQQVVLKTQSGTDSPFSVKIWECTNDVEGKECDTVNSTPISSTMVHYAPGGARHIYKFETNPAFAKNTQYLVEVPAATKGLGEFGKQMAQKQGCRPGVAYCFTFKTAADEEACKVAKVEIMPFDWTATEYGIQKSYNDVGDLVDQLWHAQAFGSNPCVWLKNKYQWKWGIDEKHAGYAAVDPSAAQAGEANTAAGLVGKYWDFSDDQVVAAYKETASGDFVKVQAETEGVIGESLMDIHFPTPTITKYEPSSCGGANVCTNSAIVLGFSTPMKKASIDSHAFVFMCPAQGNPDCTFVDANVKDLIPLTAYPTDNSSKEFALFGSSRFDMNTKYRVILTDGMYSTAHKKLVQVNYPSDKPKYFSWTFSVTKDQCSADSVKVSPVAPMATAQGQKQTFIALAFTAPDSCYPNGQQINTADIPWTWASSDVAVADQVIATTTNRQTFTMIGNGTVVDSVQSTNINATIQSKVGTSIWKLECNAPPVKCPVGTWPGADKCCHEPPSVQATYPKAGSSGICRNTLGTIDVNEYLSGQSVTSSSVRLGFAVVDAKECDGGVVEQGFCYNKISYNLAVVNTKEKDEKRNGRVVINLNELLPANRKINLQIRPVGTYSPTNVGLKSTLDVPVVGQDVVFSTGDNLCELTDVAVYPKKTFFTKNTETQKFAAYGLSLQSGGLLPISSIPNVYAWNWEWFSNDEKVAKFPNSTEKTGTAPTVAPGGLNGQTTVAAMATVSTDIIIKPSTVGKAVAGSGSVEAMLCEVPWFPETDQKIKNILGIYNMSFWYCRSDAKSPLPSVTPVEDKLSDLNFTTTHSFRLVDSTSGGAIGFRVEKNLKQYSPLEWYLQKEFKGNPEKIVVDGFNSVRVGNTVYIGFGNKANSGAQYTNILIISLSEPASENMKAIFSQVVQNLQFVTNVNDIGLCYNKNNNAVNKLCNADYQCAAIEAGATCNVAQSKFRRDMIRVVDASTIVRSIENAKALAQKYPIIATNSFIPGLASSKWPAWNSFMQQLGIDLVADPVNVYTGCGPDSDPETCWSVKNKKYQCAASSLTYHYRTINSGANYALGIPLEQEVSLQGLWQGDGWASAKPKIENTFCTGAAVVAQSVCGDGAVGAGEQCDPAGAHVGGVNTIACSKYGDFVAKCSATCQFEQVACVNKCGDGIVQAGVEECDEGSKYNGQYNHCGADCKKANPLGYCGNSVIDKNEVCDIGTPSGRVFVNKYFSHAEDQSHFAVRCVTDKDGYEAVTFNPSTKVIEHDKWRDPYAKDPTFSIGSISTLGGICKTTQTIGQCDLYPMLSCLDNENCPGSSVCVKPIVGTKYAQNAADSCNWNCKGSGSYCGDKIVDAQSGEECDGNQQSTNAQGKQCTKFCTPECKWQAQALNQATNKTEPVCVENAGQGPAAFVGCGDGSIDPGAGEECDAGKQQNGIQCVPNYGQNNSCQYCTSTCKKGFVTGAFCGDGKTAGPEFCDGYDTLALCPSGTDYSTVACKLDCSAADKSKPGGCFVCDSQTFIKSAVNPAAGESVTAQLVLSDWTLGWFPLRTITNGSAAGYISMEAIGAPVPNGYQTEPFKLYLGTKSATGSYACFSAKHNGYKLTTYSHPTSYTDAYAGLTSTIGPELKPKGGAFSYVSTITNFEKPEAASQNVVVEPEGSYGDYRIVLTGNTNPNLEISMTVPDELVGTDVFPTPTGYVLTTAKYFQIGAPYFGCQSNGYNVAAFGGSPKADVLGADKKPAAQLNWFDGCSTQGPYAQIESASPVDPTGKLGARTVVATLRPFNGSAYYAGIYQFKVSNFDSSSELSIYFNEGTPDSNKHNWRLVKKLKSTDPGSKIVKPLFGPSSWYPFFFMPEAITVSNKALGVKFRPEEALWGNIYEPSADKLLK